jgi:hypothetical protein
MRPKSYKKYFYLAALILFFSTSLCYAGLTVVEISKEEKEKVEVLAKEDWLDRFDLKRDEFAEKYGTTFSFLLNYSQQVILRDGINKGETQPVWYISLDASQRLWQGSTFFLELEVDKNKGIDKFIPTYSFFNDNGGKNASLYIPLFYLEQKLFKDKVTLDAGKLDLSDWFDLNMVANSADTQFLSTALINSYTIPFPAKGTAALAQFNPYDWFYFQAGAGTAKASSTKVGLSDAFNSTLFLSEFGLSPKIKGLQGNYRFLYFFLRKKADLIEDDSENESNQAGFSLSFDQEISKRFILFLRYGFANPKVNEIAYAWSGGFQVNEPIPGRKNDYCAFGVAQNILSRNYRGYIGSDITASRETMLEGYYNFYLNEFLSLTVDIQAVLEPAADKNVHNPITAGVRLLAAF